MFQRSPVRFPVDPWKNVPEQGVLGFFHGSAGGWAGGGPTDPSGSMEQNEADVHRLDHILRGEVGISCNSMPLEHNLLVTG